MSKLRELVAKLGVEGAAKKITERLVPETRVLSYELRADVAKSGFFRPEYSFDVPLSSTSVDLQGQRMSESFLKSLPSRVDKVNGFYADDHPERFSDRVSEPDFEMDNLRFENGRLVGTVHILKNGPRASEIVKGMKDKSVKGVSIELKRALLADHDSLIMDAESINGFIITSKPANRDTLFKQK